MCVLEDERPSDDQEDDGSSEDRSRAIAFFASCDRHILSESRHNYPRVSQRLLSSPGLPNCLVFDMHTKVILMNS